MSAYHGKRRSPLASIRAYCLWCCSESAPEVRLCPSTGCAFYYYRMGVIPPGKSRKLMAAIKSRCLECAADGKPTECDAFQEYAGNPPCPCWPYRLGRNPNIGTAQREKLRALGKEKGFKPSPQAQSGPRINPNPSVQGKGRNDDKSRFMLPLLALSQP